MANPSIDPQTPSPAEAYASFRQKQASPLLAAFADGYGFVFDDYQREACAQIEAGSGVLVAAPSGAGKTIVGEFAVFLALENGRKCFYTTPIKALSNQKYADLVRRHGASSVGLLTGDTSVNAEAPIVVMTTEVLRNMIYARSSTLSNLGYVVLDEVHYLADRFRGAVWEEVIIGLADSIQLVALSATVSNAEEFGDWLSEVRGEMAVVVSERRPVPLFQHVLVGPTLYDLFAELAPTAREMPGEGKIEVNPALIRIAREESRLVRDDARRPRGRSGRGRRTVSYGSGAYGGAAHRATYESRGRRPRSLSAPSRPELVELLDDEALLPAIVFIFSRIGCDAAVRQLLSSRIELTDDGEQREISLLLNRHVSGISDADLRALDYDQFAEALIRGVAAHHAGMLPAFKEGVEEAFVRGLVKVVFATETLALGINMPARSVVLERLVKFNGESHADVTPGEYTQLTGRAGRRGIDVEGHAVVLWAPGVDPEQVAGLASTRTYPLRSSFRPSYNMAVNLAAQLSRAQARELLERSFAQFQADRAVVGLARQVDRNVEALAGYAESMRCHVGDFAEYAQLRAQLKERESALAREGAAQRRAAAEQSLDRLRVGDVIRVPSGKRSGMAVVVDPGVHPARETRPLVVTEDRWAGRLSPVDFPTPVEPLARVKVPKHFDHRSAQARRDLASTLRNARPGDAGPRRRGRSAAADDAEIARLRKEIRQHPCHGCADREEHARWAERYARLRRDTDALRGRVENRTHSIARTFDQVCALLTDRGYLTG